MPDQTVSPSSEMRLLRTKLFVPRAHAELVARPRLLTRLDAGQRCKLTLVSAPAGFGKTTLLSTWSAEHDVPVAWVSLDERDNDPPRFWAYVIAGLQTVWSNVGETASAMLRAPQAPPIEGILTELLNDVVAQNETVALVLDDYHAIADDEIHAALTFLLENAPPQLRLIIVSRTDPPLSLPLLRARRQLVELRAADLRFTPEEVEAFFGQMEGLTLDDEDVTALESLTEGWAAGLQLAALSVLEVEDVSAFIQTFSGSHRYIFDYLAHEVLNRQPPAVRAFLLQTALLDRFDASLCEAVTGKADSQTILEALEAANLFIVPLDQRRHWYRYHHLFSDFLQAQLEQEAEPQERVELHRRAGLWYEVQGYPSDAIQHALAGGDAERAAVLIQQVTGEMFQRSELRTLMQWIGALPERLLAQDTFLNMAMAWALLATGQSEAVEPHIQAVERLLEVNVEKVDASCELPTDVRGALAEIACIRASLAFNRFDLPRAKDLAQIARACLADPQAHGLYNQNLSLRGVAAFNLALAHEYAGETSDAVAAFEDAVDVIRADQNMHLLPMSISHQGQLYVVQGQLHAAAQTYERALASMETDMPPSPLSGVAYTGLAQVLYEWNDLQQAVTHLERGVELGKQWVSWDVLLPGYAMLADIAMARGDPEQAIAYLDTLTEYVQQWEEIQWALPTIASQRARLAVRRGDLEAAQWAATCQLNANGPIPYMQENDALLLARVWLAQDKADAAADLLARLLASNEAAERWGRVIQVRVLQALMHDARGDQQAAVTALTRALERAEPEGYVRTFVDEGAPLHALLAHVDVLPAYVTTLQAAFDQPKPEPAEDATGPASQLLVEPLTDRELDVLRLIAQGLTNQQIADRLFISVNTVKTHAKHIYEKLNVRNRAQATTRAAEMGLL